MRLAVGKIPVLQLAGASRHDDTGRKLDTLDLSGQKYVSAYDRPISVLTPPLELTSIVALRPSLRLIFLLSVFRVRSAKVSHAGEQTSSCI